MKLPFLLLRRDLILEILLIEFESLKKLTSGLEMLLNDETKSEVKAKIVQKLVSKIENGTDSVNIHLVVGKKS